MRKIREFSLGPEGQNNYYHVVSRTTGRDILFDLLMLRKELKLKMTLAYNKKHGRGGGFALPSALF